MEFSGERKSHTFVNLLGYLALYSLRSYAFNAKIFSLSTRLYTKAPLLITPIRQHPAAYQADMVTGMHFTHFGAPQAAPTQCASCTSTGTNLRTRRSGKRFGFRWHHTLYAARRLSFAASWSFLFPTIRSAFMSSAAHQDTMELEATTEKDIWAMNPHTTSKYS